MALKSGHMAYLSVAPQTILGANKFLDSVQADGGTKYGYTFPSEKPSTSAVGLLCRMYLGWKQDNPALKGLPVIVGGDPGRRGVVSAASYEARVFGVHSAMPSSQARRLCPNGIFLPVRMGRYQEVSEQIFRILREYTPLVEPLSLDESFLDVTGSEKLFGPALQIAREIKRRIRENTDLTASAGIAPNKFLAKIASDYKKPDGLVEIKPEEVRDFLRDLPITKLWGVGKSTEEVLKGMGVLKVGQLAVFPAERIEKKLGPQMDGEDAHFSYGLEQVYPGDNFDCHLVPFEAAFQAGTAQIMPYYGMPVGTSYEEVGFGFNKDVINGLLRGRYGFDGVVCTDWSLLTSMKIMGREVMPARAWGVDGLSLAERAQKVLEAGVDQFGGETCPDVIVQLVREGRDSEERIDQSGRRLLRDKFRLGLFDNPYVDVEAAEKIVGQPAFRRSGELAQRKSIVLLKNDRQTLPLKSGLKIYVEGIQPEAAGRVGQVVRDPAQADIAILEFASNGVEVIYYFSATISADALHSQYDVPHLNSKARNQQKIPTINLGAWNDDPIVVRAIVEKVQTAMASIEAPLKVKFSDPILE